MNNLPNDAVIEKIRKCLALAHGKNATPGEMEAAMGKAKEIALRYNIEIGSINLEEGKSAGAGMQTGKHEIKLRSKKEQKYHRYINWTLQEVFSIRVIRFGGYGFCYIGEATDVAIATALFPWLEDVFYSTYYTAKKEGRVISCAAHKNGIYEGLWLGLVRANKREEEKLDDKDKGTMALVLRDKKQIVDAAVALAFPKLKSSKQRDLDMSQDAKMIGFNKGKTIKLNQLGGAAQRNQIGN